MLNREGVTGRRSILRNLLWGNINVGVRYLTSFVATAIIARSFSTKEFGIYQLALTYAIVFENINLLNTQHLRNHLVNNPDDENSVISCWIIQSFFFWIIFSLVSIVMIFSSDTSSEKILWVVTLLVTFRLFFKVWEYVQLILDVRLRSDLAQKVQTVSFASFNISRIAVSLLGGSLISLACMSGVQGFLTTIYQKRFYSFFGHLKSISWDWKKYWLYVSDGLPLSVVTILSMLQVRILTVVVAERMDPSDFGNLQLILRLIEPATTIGLVVFGANYTVLAHTLKATPDLFANRFSKIASMTLLLSSLVVCAILLIPTEYLLYFFGNEYANAISNLALGCGVVVSSLILGIIVLWDQLNGKYGRIVFRYLIIISGYIILINTLKNVYTIKSILMLQAGLPLLACMSLCVIQLVFSFFKNRMVK